MLMSQTVCQMQIYSKMPNIKYIEIITQYGKINLAPTLKQ